MRLLRLPPSPKSRRLLLVLTGTACVAALAASAMGTSSPHASPSSTRAYVPAQFFSAARTNPSHVYRVILQGHRETQLVSAVRANGVSIDRRLGAISGASAAVTGRQLLQLSAAKGVAAITLDRPVHLLDNSGDPGGLYSTQEWPYAVKAQADWCLTTRRSL